MSTRLSSRAERINEIEQLLFRSQEGLRAVELAAACEVDRRTIYRDLEAMMKTGIPVYQKDGRFYISQDYYLATLRLSLNEAVTVLLALRSLLHQQEQQNPHVISVLRKLRAIMPDLPAQHVEQVVQSLWSSPIDRAYVEVLETVIRAWGERRMVRLWDGETVIEFGTYFLEPSLSGGIDAFGLDMQTLEARTLPLRRIKRARLLKNPYLYPSEQELQMVPRDSARTGAARLTMEVLIVFTAEAAAARQGLWGELPLERTPDNRYLLRLLVTDWRSLLPWLRSWGAQIEVLAPQALRDQLLADATALATAHARPS